MSKMKSLDSSTLEGVIVSQEKEIRVKVDPRLVTRSLSRSGVFQIQDDKFSQESNIIIYGKFFIDSANIDSLSKEYLLYIKHPDNWILIERCKNVSTFVYDNTGIVKTTFNGLRKTIVDDLSVIPDELIDIVPHEPLCEKAIPNKIGRLKYIMLARSNNLKCRK